MFAKNKTLYTHSLSCTSYQILIRSAGAYAWHHAFV